MKKPRLRGGRCAAWLVVFACPQVDLLPGQLSLGSTWDNFASDAKDTPTHPHVFKFTHLPRLRPSPPLFGPPTISRNTPLSQTSQPHQYLFCSETGQRCTSTAFRIPVSRFRTLFRGTCTLFISHLSDVSTPRHLLSTANPPLGVTLDGEEKFHLARRGQQTQEAFKESNRYLNLPRPLSSAADMVCDFRVLHLPETSSQGTEPRDQLAMIN